MGCIKPIVGGILIFASLVSPKFNTPKEIVDLQFPEVVVLDVELPKQEVNQLNDPIYGGVTDTDVNNKAKLVWAEAGHQSELGKRLVIDVILNRVEANGFGSSIDAVIFAPGQFSPVSSGSFYKSPVDPEIVKLIYEELEARTDYNVIFFRTKHYHCCGHPYMIEGAHYFSTV